MPYYHVPGTATANTSSYKTNSSTIAPATATRRGKICEINLGTAANPNATDTYIEWDVSRLSTTGAGVNTAFTPNPLDSADGAATTVAGIIFTTEPSYLASSTLKHWGMNQRNSLRWVAQQESQMLIWPATCAQGIGLRSQSSTFTACTIGTVDFME